MDKLPFYYKGKIVYITLEWTTNKNMYLKIKNDKDILCLAPKRTSMKDIQRFCEANISNFMTYIEKKESNTLFDLSKKVLYLSGLKYKIQTLSTITKPTYKIIDKTIYLYYNNDDEVENLYKKILLDNIGPRIVPLFSKISTQMNVPEHSLELKYLISKWGSNTLAKKSIQISTRIAHFDDQSLVYLLVHEFAHYFEPNHSNRFYAIVEQFVPNYKELRKKLKFIDEEK